MQTHYPYTGIDHQLDQRRCKHLWAVSSASTTSPDRPLRSSIVENNWDRQSLAIVAIHLQVSGLVIGNKLKGSIENETIESELSTGTALQNELISLLSQVRIAVENESIPRARKLLRRAIQLGMENEPLNYWRRVLAPPLAKPQAAATGIGTKASITWLHRYAAQYRGKWVALRDGELIADADTRVQLHRMLKSKEGCSSITIVNLSE
jgi:hypothetical protein